MANTLKAGLLSEIESRFGKVHKLPGSNSLYQVGEARVYFRYSKIHPRSQCFFGLRSEDLRQLQGHPSAICFMWPGQKEPLYLPFSDFEEVFHACEPAGDGQYKAQVYLSEQGTELYLAKAGRFNVDGYWGWQVLTQLVHSCESAAVPALSHCQVQGLLAVIGNRKEYDIWIPLADRPRLEGGLAERFPLCVALPPSYERVKDILAEVDVVWVERGSGKLRALFEVEHSTPIYSGLLRLNDVHLVLPSVRTSYAVVANDERRALFARQLCRPTFVASGINDLCAFMRYENVYSWYLRTVAKAS